MFAQQRDAALPGVLIPVKHGRCLAPLLAGGRGKLSLIATVQRADSDAMREQCSGEGTFDKWCTFTVMASPAPQCSNTVTANKRLAHTQKLQLSTPLVYVEQESDMRVSFANTTTLIS